MKEFKKLLQFADGYKFMYLLGMITIVIAQIFNTAGPLIISNTVDSIVGSEPISSKLFQDLVDVLGGKSFLANNLWIIGIIIV